MSGDGPDGLSLGAFLILEVKLAHKQNYVERMELNRQRRSEAGLISERFPEVLNIIIRMTYFQRGDNPVLMERTMDISPATGYAYFNMYCMIRDCVGGGFDLTPAITAMIKQRKKKGEGRLKCCGKSEALAPDHASLAYEVEIKYKKD